MKKRVQNSVYVDRWLRFIGIEFIDVRFELTDHLITEYEQTNADNLDDFMKSRLDWCKLTARKKEKTMHWGVQKALWKRFLNLCLNFKILLPILLFLLIVAMVPLGFSEKATQILLLAPVFITIAIFIYFFTFRGFSWEKQERVLAIRKLATLLAFPQVFLTLLMFPSDWMKNFYVIIPAVLLMTIMNIAAILEYRNRYTKILKEYELLKVHMA